MARGSNRGINESLSCAQFISHLLQLDYIFCLKSVKQLKEDFMKYKLMLIEWLDSKGITDHVWTIEEIASLEKFRKSSISN